MNTQTGHLLTMVGEHIADGEFEQDTDSVGMLRTAGRYPDVRSNVMYELKLDGGQTLNLYDVHKDPDDREHVYHCRLKPLGD